MLSRRWIVNGLLILAILLVALIGYRLDAPTESVPAASSAGPAKVEIEKIEIETATIELSLQNDETGWTILEPVHWPANRASVERLLSLVETGGTPPLDAGGADLAALGLDNPVARLRLGDTRVSFGATNNIGERRYTMIGSDLFLLADAQLPFILQGLSGFVDRRLLPPRFPLTSLALPGLELRRDDKGSWRAVGGDDIAAARFEELARAWQNLEASRIGPVDDKLPIRAEIAAGLVDGERHEFRLLSTDPEIVIANPGLGLQYHFRRELLDRLIVPGDYENPA